VKHTALRHPSTEHDHGWSAGRPCSRRGFSLIEMLLVTAIIAVLVALLLPAVEQCREAARRTQCQNNLSQIAIALTNYEMAFSTLPPGTVNATGPIVNAASPDEYHVSWTVQILPFLELETVHRRIDFRKGVYDPVNLLPQQRNIDTFRCPSDTPATLPDRRKLTNFAGVHSSKNVPIDVNQDGLLFLNSRVGYGDIPDGSSCTLAVGERIGDPDEVWGWASGTRDTLRNGGTAINGILIPAPTAFAPGFDDTAGKEDQAPADPRLAVGGFSSRHVGGANFAFADGSVHFLSENINLPTYHNLCSRNDGAMESIF
jgi:prepilin-type N-terminal cleavage/methylation domain-containing protein/prepilin-type processing-associated H-X9-DG protein